MIVACSGNAYLADAVARVNRMRRLIEYNHQTDRSRLVVQAREHLQILDLLEAGDNEKASDFLYTHLDTVRGIKTGITDRSAYKLPQTQPWSLHPPSSTDRPESNRKADPVKYARVETHGATRWAALHDNHFRLLDGSPYDGGRPQGPELAPDDVRLLAPVAPSKIFCLGRNYADHRSEMGYGHDGAPSVFMKGPSTVIGPGDNIVLPPRSMSTHVEYEAELAVIIGRTARFVSAAAAGDYILGYTCANDVSARDLQRGDPHPTRGKGLTLFVLSDPGSKPNSTRLQEFGFAAASTALCANTRRRQT
jgi:hypothetical protein